MINISDFVRLCHFFGGDIFHVQGSGGNISLKDDLEMLITASGGSLLAVSEQNPGTRLSLSVLQNSLSGISSWSRQTEVAPLVVEAQTNPTDSRASMETPFHFFLSAPCVVHTHFIPANILSCAQGGQEILQEIFLGNCEMIPFFPPGALLARGFSQNAHPHAELIFLENHGMVIAGNDPESVIQRAQKTKAAILNFLEKQGVFLAPPDLLSENDTCFTAPFPFVSEILERIQDGCFSSHLFPDSIVFSEQFSFFSQKPKESKKPVVVLSSGTLSLFGFSPALAKIVYENLWAIGTLLSAQQKCGLSPQFVPSEEVEMIANMEAEKYRRKVV